MGSWRIDTDEKPGILLIRLEGAFTEPEMERFVSAHNAAINDLDGADYRVFCDIRELSPLSPEVSAILTAAKSYSAGRSNFRGSAVLVASSIVSMQHQRTSVAGGVMDTERISENEAVCWAHLAKVNRTR